MQQRRLGLWALTGILLVVLSGCQVQFVSRYDAPTDEGVTALQKKVSQHLVTLQGQAAPECVFTNHEAFYIDALSDVQVLLTRANAINTDGLNDLTVSQLSNTQDSLETLRNLHRDLGDT